MSNLGGPSYDAASANFAGLSDQCASIAIPLDETVRVYQFGSSINACEEWWRLWIPAAIDDPGRYFSIVWSSTSTPSPLAADLTPGVSKQRFGMAPAGLPWFLVRVPRGKPFGFYLWSGGDEEELLYGTRVWPHMPSVSSGP